MTQLRFFPASLFASAALAAAVLVPAPAHALLAEPGCTADSDCAKGFECSVVGSSGCAAAAPCAPGSSCPEPEPCEPTVQKACTPAHCASNADCAEGMVCVDGPSECVTIDCACPPDDADCDCAVPACDPAPNKLCAPRYVLPCQVAADCGEGFTCEEQLSCGCSGSSGSDPGEPQPGAAPTPAGGAAPADAAPPPDCACEPSGEKRCIAQEIVCTTAADCPIGWSCTTAAVAGDAPACSGGDCGAAAPRPLPQSVCIPEYYGGGDDDAPGTPTKGEDGSGTGTDNGGGVPPQPEATGGGESNESSACQMGRAPARSGAFGLLVVLGALLGLKRRRA